MRHLRQASLAAAIGFVTQESYLFHDSILANVLDIQCALGDLRVLAYVAQREISLWVTEIGCHSLTLCTSGKSWP